MAAPALKQAHRPKGTFSVVATLAGAYFFFDGFCYFGAQVAARAKRRVVRGRTGESSGFQYIRILAVAGSNPAVHVRFCCWLFLLWGASRSARKKASFARQQRTPIGLVGAEFMMGVCASSVNVPACELNRSMCHSMSALDPVWSCPHSHKNYKEGMAINSSSAEGIFYIQKEPKEPIFGSGQQEPTWRGAVSGGVLIYTHIGGYGPESRCARAIFVVGFWCFGGFRHQIAAAHLSANCFTSTRMPRP